MILEICVDSVESALAAERGGADRLEVCSSLAEGGLTPGFGLTHTIMTATHLPVMMMVRPRGGSFVYNDYEIETMRAEIAAAKSLGVAGVVFGALTSDRRIDQATCETLMADALPLSTTFHRAFDETVNPFQAAPQLVDLGFDRVLTSGQGQTAAQGMTRIRQLVELAHGRLTVMAGGGIRPNNVADIVRVTGVQEVHGTASESVSFAGELLPRRVTSAASVAQIRLACRGLVREP
jgi:copper homeostasis protein